jgi:hypothetical protein
MKKIKITIQNNNNKNFIKFCKKIKNLWIKYILHHLFIDIFINFLILIILL